MDINIKKICEHCNKEYEVPRYKANKQKYCSRECANKSNIRTGEKIHNYNGGVYINDGRKHLKTSKGYEAEYRLIMEKHLGRKLSTTEIVHHIDGDKTNNELDNLQIVTRAEHARIHGTKPKIKVDCFNCGEEMLLRQREINKGQKFCSKSCYYESKRKVGDALCQKGSLS